MISKIKSMRPFLSLMLAAVLVISSVPVFSLRAHATSNMKISDAGVDLIKGFEGFLKYAVWDYGQWTIGYGTGVPKDAYPDGITTEEAEVLLREYISSFEKSLNRFIDTYNVSLNQNQFDAMMSFIYNLGPNVLFYEKMTLRDMIVSGNYTDKEITDEFKTWSHAGGVQLEGLVRRRQKEAELFLTPVSYYEVWRVTATNNSLRFRNQMSINAMVIDYIPQNTLILVTNRGYSDGYNWGYTKYNGSYGWCSLEYAECVFKSGQKDGGIFKDWCFPVLELNEQSLVSGACISKSYVDGHSGIDIKNVTSSTEVHATKSGSVCCVSNICTHNYPKESTCCCEDGNYVIIDHRDGTYSAYRNMSSATVSNGQWVNKGDVLGYCGATGNSNQIGLHFEIRIGKFSSAQNYENMATVNPLCVSYTFNATVVKSVSHSINNNTLTFTVVTDNDKLDRIKLTRHDGSSTVVSSSDSFEIDGNGDYVWTISASRPKSETLYSFDFRSYANLTYIGREYEYSVNPNVSTTILSATAKKDGDYTVFTVVTVSGKFDRIKLASLADPSSSLAVSTTRTEEQSGNYVWSLKYKGTSSDGYAFDLREEETQKYCKDYYYLSPSSEEPEELSVNEVWRVSEALRLRSSYSSDFSVLTVMYPGEYMVVTEKVSSDGHIFGKAQYNGLTGWCPLEYAEKTVDIAKVLNGWYWPVKSSGPAVYSDSSWLAQPYSLQNGGIDIKNVNSLTPVYAAKSGYLYPKSTSQAIIDHGDNTFSMYGNLSSVTVAAGYYVNQGDVIGYCGNESVHFEIRGGTTGSTILYSSFFALNPLEFNFSYDKKLVKDVSCLKSGDKLMFTVVTEAGDFGRIKLTDITGTPVTASYSDKYTVNSNGNFVWNITVDAPLADKEYTFALRSASTLKYSVNYSTYDYIFEQTEKAIKSVTSFVKAGVAEFTVVTVPGNWDRLKLSYANDISSSIAIATSYEIDANGNYVWVIKYESPNNDTIFAFDLRSSDASKYIKDYFSYKLEYKNTSPILHASSKIEAGKVTFEIVTEPGEYNRIKVSDAETPLDSIAVGNSYTVNQDGNYVWEVKMFAPTSSSTYAFDLRNSKTSSYLKNYLYYELLVTDEDDVSPIIAVSDVESNDKITFTVVTGLNYNRVKVADSENISGYLVYESSYAKVGSVKVWILSVPKQENGKILTFDARAISDGKYTKNYYTYTCR